MLKLDEKDYDLNNLLGLNFDMLKEVLLKLSSNQNNINIEIKDVKDSNEQRDKKISDLENKIKELNDYIKDKDKEREMYKHYIIKEIPNKNIEEKEKKGINDKKEEKEKYNNIIKNENIEENINKDENINKEDNIKEESINIETKINIRENKIQESNIIPKIELNAINDNKPKSEREKVNKEIQIQILNENEEIKPHYTYYKEKVKEKDKENGKNPIYRTSEEIIDLNSAVLQKSQMSYDIIRSILHSISELSEKMNFLEENLNQKNEEFIKKSKKLLSEHIVESMSKINSINKKADIMFSKNEELQEKSDELELKIYEIEQKLEMSKNRKPEIIQIFNDDEDKNEQKIMSSTFKESINKKFELNENRYKQAAGDNFKLNQKVLVLKGNIDKINRQISLLKDDNKEIKDNIDSLKKDTNELIENKNNELKNDLKEEIDKKLNDINNYIDNKIREFLDYISDGKINKDTQTNKESNPENYNLEADRALIKLLNKKVTELNEKIEAMEEDIKNQTKKNNAKNKEIDDIKQCIVEFYDNINSKIGKDDLKELYGFYLDHVNEIKLIQTKLGELSEMQEKIRNSTPNFIKRLEQLTHDIAELQESDKKKVVTTSQKQVDLSNYITEKKLKNTISPIAEEIEKLISETEYLNKMVSDISDQIKLFDKKEHVDHIENEINEKINLLNSRFGKKYIEKIEFNKIIKNIDIQIKLLQGNNNHKKEEADNWILAKQPIKCFNCATCEANIANSTPPNEYLPWNKIPHGEKQYRIGQGFSKLLKKLNRNIEDNKKNKNIDNSFDNDISNKFLLNSANNINDIMKINNRIPFKEEKSLVINIKKNKLPKVIESFRRKQKSIDNIPITDDEKDNEEAIIEKEIESNSPKILKITKVKGDNEQNDVVLGNTISRNKTGKNIGKKLNRIQSVPLY